MAENPDTRDKGIAGVGRRRDGHAGVSLAGAQADLENLVVVAEAEPISRFRPRALAHLRRMVRLFSAYYAENT